MPRRLICMVALIALVPASALAAPVTGEARVMLQRLANATGVTLLASDFGRQDAPARIEAAFKRSGKCLSATTVSAFQADTKSSGIAAMLLLESRCVTTADGQKLTPELASGVLANAGIDAARATDLTSLLNNPVSTNALLRASRRPVTPKSCGQDDGNGQDQVNCNKNKT